MVEVQMAALPFVLLAGLSPTRGQDPNSLAQRNQIRETPTGLVSRGGKSCGPGRPGGGARAASRRSKQQGHIGLAYGVSVFDPIVRRLRERG
jgi:hypothetical protein